MTGGNIILGIIYFKRLKQKSLLKFNKSLYRGSLLIS